MNVRRFQVLQVVALVSVLPGVALAEPPAPADEARKLFEEGRDLVKAGNVAEGCPKLERSSALAPGVGVRFHLADCWEKLGRTASARALFLGAAATAKAAGQADREQVLRERAAALEPLLARLVVSVEQPSDGLVVKRDALPLENESWGSAVAVDPGKYVVSASAAGKRTWSENVEVPPGQTITVAVPALEPAAAEPVVAAPLEPKPAPKPVVTTPPPLPAKRGPNITALVAGSLGAGSLIVSGVMGLRYVKANGEAEDICPQSLGCSKQDISDHQKLVDEASTARAIAITTASIGVIGLAVAGIAYFNRSGQKDRAGLTVDAVVSDSGGVATLRGNF